MQKTKECNETQLGSLPKNWKVVKLIELVNKKSDIVGGPFGSNLKVNDYKNQGIPIVRLQNIERNKFVNKDIKYVSEKKAEELKYHSFLSGDIILAKLGDPIGKTCIVPDYFERGIVVADVVRIRLDNEIADKWYTVYALNSILCELQFRRQKTGTTRPRVNVSNVRNIKIPLPPIEEQRKISYTLSMVQSSKEKTEKLIESLELFKKSIMRYLFTYGPVKIEDAELIEMDETEIGDISKEWNVIKVNEYFEFTRKPKKIKLEKDQSIPFIPMELISETKKHANFKIKRYSEIKSGTFILKNDLIVAKITPSFENGKQALLNNLPMDYGYATTEVWSLHPKNDNVLNEFLYNLLKIPQIRKELASKMEGSTGRKRLPLDVLKNMKIPLPPIEIQREIVKIISVIDEKIEKEGNKKMTLEELFNSLLNSLITAKIRVNNMVFNYG